MASIVAFDKIKIDDPVGAISVHGVAESGGSSLFFSPMETPLLWAVARHPRDLCLWTFVTSLIVWSVIKAVIGIRISEEEEMVGSDVTDIGIEAYPEFTKSYLIRQVRVPLWGQSRRAGSRRRTDLLVINQEKRPSGRFFA